MSSHAYCSDQTAGSWDREHCLLRRTMYYIKIISKDLRFGYLSTIEKNVLRTKSCLICLNVHCHVKFMGTDFRFGFLRCPHRLRFDHRGLINCSEKLMRWMWVDRWQLLRLSRLNSIFFFVFLDFRLRSSVSYTYFVQLYRIHWRPKGNLWNVRLHSIHTHQRKRFIDCMTHLVYFLIICFWKIYRLYNHNDRYNLSEETMKSIPRPGITSGFMPLCLCLYMHNITKITNRKNSLILEFSKIV